MFNLIWSSCLMESFFAWGSMSALLRKFEEAGGWPRLSPERKFWTIKSILSLSLFTILPMRLCSPRDALGSRTLSRLFSLPALRSRRASLLSYFMNCWSLSETCFGFLSLTLFLKMLSFGYLLLVGLKFISFLYYSCMWDVCKSRLLVGYGEPMLSSWFPGT